MGINARIKDADGLVAEVHEHDGTSGLVTFSRDDNLWAHTPLFFVNSEYGIAMNQDVTFGGTPEPIHDGENRTLWTASDIVGTSTDFSNASRANQSAITIVNYANFEGGEIVTVNSTVFTEGSGWTAGTNNNTTAASLASLIDGTAGFSATSSGAVVSVTETAGAGITIFTTDAISDELTLVAPESAQFDNMAVADVFEFVKGSDVTMSGFVALTMWINVDKNWAAGDSVSVYAYDTAGAAQVGNRVLLEDYFDELIFDTWHSIIIPVVDMGIEASTIVDGFRFEQVSKDGPKSPTFYLDAIDLQNTGSPIVFRITKDSQRDFWIHSLRFTFRDDITVLEPNKFMGLPALPNGVVYQRYEDGEVQFTVAINTLQSLMTIGGVISNQMFGASETYVSFDVVFAEPIVLRGRPERNYIALTVSDELAGLSSMQSLVIGAYRDR